MRSWVNVFVKGLHGFTGATFLFPIAGNINFVQITRMYLSFAILSNGDTIINLFKIFELIVSQIATGKLKHRYKTIIPFARDQPDFRAKSKQFFFSL